MARSLCTHAAVWAAVVLVLACFAAPSLAADCAALNGDLGFPHCIEFTSNYSMAWLTNDEYIWIAVDLTTDSNTSWAGIGPSEAGGMKGSDLWFIRRTPEGGVGVTDTWSTKFGRPLPDAEQNVVLVAPLAEGQTPDAETPADVIAKITEEPGRLRALIRRTLHSCDTRDLAITPGEPQAFVYAHADAPGYHGPGNRGTLTLDFAPPEGKDPVLAVPTGPLPANTATLDLNMPNVSIPTAPTSYLCTYFQLPSDKKYQITAQEPIVQTSKLHHIILFGCNTGVVPTDPTAVFDCTTPPLNCSTFVIAWAPGIKYTEFPEEAGFPFGTSPDDPTLQQWFVMQVHYNNPMGEESVVPDTSGLRLTYTSELRPNDLGVITVGQFNLAIPGQKSTALTPVSVCPSECTTKLEEPVTMVYSFLHMHETGRSIITRHIRGDTELAPVGQKRYYDFNFQGMSVVPENTATLLPGDILTTQCIYSTMGRDNYTFWGENTADEMCFNFITGYPRSAITKASYCWNGIAGTPELAYCGTGTSGFTGNVGDVPPERYFAELLSRGLIVNATAPGFYKTWSKPECTPAEVAPLGV